MKRNLVFILLPILLLLTACTGSISEEQEKANERALKTFNEQSISPNSETDHFSFYLPSNLSIEESDQNNILMSKGSQMYLLFINPNEDQTSEVIYETTLKNIENVRFTDTFESSGKFGFIIISDIEEDIYELTIGIGGAKLTTNTTTDDLAHDAELMMEIVASLEPKQG